MRSGRCCSGVVLVVLLVAGLVAGSGCDTEDPFVIGILPSLEAAATSLVSGVVAGVFNVIIAQDQPDEEPEPTDAAKLTGDASRAY